METMLRDDLKWKRSWFVLGWVAVILALVLNLMPERDLRAIHVNDKLEHITGYVLLTLWFCGIYPKTRYRVIAVMFAVMGALVEVLQGAMHWGRSEDIRDFYADCIGIAIGLALAWLGANQWPRWIERLFKRA
jgi:VanZ family protein